jgi:hypothetical protein
MGWRYRKSINLGLGFRINLSKSGIGYSWGFPGYRVTKMANGGNRTTYSLPGTGISYVEQSGRNSRNNNSDGLFVGETESFNNIPMEELKKNDPILKGINKVVSLNRLSNILLFMTLLVYYNPIFSLCLIAGIILKLMIKLSKKVELYYEFDDESRKMYNSLKEVLIILSNSKKMWQINSSTRVYNTKYNAGAGSNVSRNNAFITSKMPWFIKTNINIYGLNLRNQKMFFTPDRVLVFRPFGKVFGCTYNDMFLGINTTRFVESERVYKDVEIVDYTWKYANRDGGRDLRFSGNRKFPVCKYGEFTIKSPNGINTVIEFSNHNLSGDIQSNLILFGNQFNKILAKSKGIIKDNQKEENNIDNDNKEKIIITDISQLIDNNSLEKTKIKNSVNKDYKLPSISILSDDESKNIIPFIEKMKKQKKTYIPLGTYQDDILLEDIGSMPNMLIGGTVMSGKTSYINTIISSILLTKKPSDIKLVIYDSKKVDYAVYNGVPHLLCPVITDSNKLSIVLQKVCAEIELRTSKLRQENIKNVDLLNKNLDENSKIPDILIIIDDFSTLNFSEEISNSIEFITSNGWNVNVYVIVSANHPSAKVISSVSKSNFPSRLSFKVVSSQASQIIIDDVGAEKLNGFGMALYTSRLNDSIIKIKVPYITDDDVSKIAKYCIEEQNEEYSLNFMENKNDMELKNNTGEYDDPMYNEVVEFVISVGKASASLLQRRFKFGYNRAARLIDLLEERGIVGPQIGSKPRDVLVKFEDGE